MNYPRSLPMKIHNESRSDALSYTNIKGGTVFDCMYMRDLLMYVGICELPTLTHEVILKHQTSYCVGGWAYES